MTIENTKKLRDEFQAKLNKKYSSFEEFVENCAVNIYSSEASQAAYESQDKLFNLTQFLTAYAKEDALYIATAEESDKVVKRPISSAILLKMMMPYITKEMRKQREYDGQLLTLNERFSGQLDQIFTDIYLELAHCINLFDFKKIANVKSLDEAQKVLCGYAKFFCFGIIQNYIRDNISRDDFKNGRRADKFLADTFLPHKIEDQSPDKHGRITYYSTERLANASIYNEIPEEINENDSLAFKQARVLKYVMEYNGKFAIRTKKSINENQNFRYSILKTEPGVKNPKCYTLRVYDDKVSDLDSQIKRTTQLMNGNIQGSLLKNFEDIKALSETELDKIITDFNIPEFELDSYYHGYYHDYTGMKCNTSTAMHEVVFSQERMPYSERTERKLTQYSEEFYKNHPNYKRADEEGEIEHE